MRDHIETMVENKALDQIFSTIKSATPGEAPFALVLGAGFSHGLVPTAQEVVEEKLPLWLKATQTRQPYEHLLASTSSDARQQISKEFWAAFAAANPLVENPLKENGLPQDYVSAYKAAFDPECTNAANEPERARAFQRDLMQLREPRLNAAHFLLASLLEAQPTPSHPSQHFYTMAGLTRLILTTNFDPFLQLALQLVNQLYYISDTPILGLAEDILEDATEAVHLVYVHGTIHRRFQAATAADISKVKEKNAEILERTLSRRGVIVLGYAGWDDAIVEALRRCRKFKNDLYWCGLEHDPTRPGAFGPAVREVLRKPTANYVQIRGAGQFIGGLCSRLMRSTPLLLANPIQQRREQLELISLQELSTVRPAVAKHPLGSSIGSSIDTRHAFESARQETIARLKEAEKYMFAGGARSIPSAEWSSLQSQLAVSESMGRHEDVERLCSAKLESLGINPEQQGELRLHIGVAQFSQGNVQDAIGSWTLVVTLPGASPAHVAEALINRAIAWGIDDHHGKAIADCTDVVGMKNAPDEKVALALFSRAVALLKTGDLAGAQKDLDRVLAEPLGLSVDLKAKALANRGLVAYDSSEFQSFLDYTKKSLELVELSPAIFSLGLAYLANGRDTEALNEYQRGALNFPEEKSPALADINNATRERKWLSELRAQPVRELLLGDKPLND